MKQDNDLIAINLMLKFIELFKKHSVLWLEDDCVLTINGMNMVKNINIEIDKFYKRYDFKINQNSQNNLEIVLDRETQNYKNNLMKTMSECTILYGTIKKFWNSILGVSLKDAIKDVFKKFEIYLNMWIKEIDVEIVKFI